MEVSIVMLKRLLIPGYSHACNGQRGKALLLATALLLLFFLAGATRWLHTAWGLASFFAVLIAGAVLSSRDARRNRGQRAPAL